ncbi:MULTISPECIES: FUSC family protein [unclassified Duganella]|uniref:FUSC family protein n=1 Tax=unclassified Duganella TaxID=2636909 RepID=UPI000E350AF9|nr:MULTISPECIES: FUSC family protein [unclassified Duganella]RFP15818.1 hypothetical protein D0T23_07880 [Duganella sp. BJB475]RFP33017.1 hypothetical protein D0T21_12745 [Duganella sp. BJB476]
MSVRPLRPPPAGFSAAALCAELAPWPGRADASLRMLIACLLIVTLSMALRIPNAALSAYMVFFVSREDMATTTATGIALIGAITAAIGLTLLAYVVTIDAPALRLGLMTVLFCAGMYLSRVFVAGPIGFGIGFILLITQSTVDLYPAAEPLVRDTLWTWMALFFSILVVVLVNVLLWPARPLALLQQEARRCLAGVIDALDAQLADGAAPPHVPAGTRLGALLKLAGAGHPRLKAQLPHYAAVLRALDHLADAAAMPSKLPAAPSSWNRLLALRLACVRLRDALDNAGVAQTPEPPPPDSGADAPLVREMEHHLREIARLWPTSGPHLPEAAAQAPRRLFVADALSNPAHLQFALKTTFASMLCYVLYTAWAWPGIHTCVITCAVVALTSTGATIHKATLRIAGALVGGALALLATVFVVPHLASVGGLLMTIAPVVAASAWIAAGSERSAYFGWQIAFAFFLCILHGFGPNADVTLVRDRLVGILLGITVMSLVFKLVWPERAERRMHALLARAVCAGAALLERDPDTPLAPSEFAEYRGAILRDLADAERLAGMAAFETIRSARELVASTRRALGNGLHLALLDTAASDATPSRLGHARLLRQAAGHLDNGSDAALALLDAAA